MKKRLVCALLSLVLLVSVIPGTPLVVKAQSNMTSSQSLVDLLKKFEGFIKYPVWDVSQYSVGYGSRCPDDKLQEWRDNGITEAEAEGLLRDFLRSFESSINAFIDKHNLTMNQQQFDALVSLTYNLGAGWTYNYQGKYTTLYNAVSSGDHGAYLAYAVGLYKTSGGKPSIGHIHRRMLELQVYFYGVYGIDQVYDYKNWPDKVRYVYLDGNGGTVPNGIQAFALSHPTEILEKATAPAGTGYEFAGWFTQREGGRQVTKLNEAITNGLVLYAHWKNAAGEIVTVPQPGDDSVAVDVNVVANHWDVPIYEGPGDYFSEVRRMTGEEQLHITKVATGKDGNLWGQSLDGWVLLSKTNYDAVKPEDTPAPGEGNWYKVTASSLRVRTGPGVSYTEVRQVANGGRVNLSVEPTQQEAGTTRIWAKLVDGNWMCIQEDGVDYVTPDPNQGGSSGGSASTPTTGNTVISLSWVSCPSKRQYELNGDWIFPDLTDYRIKVHYGPNPWRDKEINVTRSMISGFDNTKEGVQDVTVTVSGKTLTFQVEIVKNLVQSIAVQKMPNKTLYVQNGEGLDLTGGTLLVTNTDGTTSEIPITADMVSGFNNTNLGEIEVELTYKLHKTTMKLTIVPAELTGIAIKTNPKTEYLLNAEALDVSGGILQLNYTGGITHTVALTADMVTGFNNSVEGAQTLTVTYQGFTTTLNINIVKPLVEFKNFDGTLISSVRYDYGAQVAVPATPTRPADAQGEYEFAGWDKEVVACTGNAVYVATYKLKYPVGDVDRNMKVDEDDAIYVLRHVIFPDKYSIFCMPDYDKNGKIDEDDAIYLLRHVVFPDKYPLG